MFWTKYWYSKGKEKRYQKGIFFFSCWCLKLCSSSSFNKTQAVESWRMFTLNLQLFSSCNICTPREMLLSLLIERTLLQPRKQEFWWIFFECCWTVYTTWDVNSWPLGDVSFWQTLDSEVHFLFHFTSYFHVFLVRKKEIKFIFLVHYEKFHTCMKVERKI